jgi:hypothetical protein
MMLRLIGESSAFTEVVVKSAKLRFEAGGSFPFPRLELA